MQKYSKLENETLLIDKDEQSWYITIYCKKRRRSPTLPKIPEIA